MDMIMKRPLPIIPLKLQTMTNFSMAAWLVMSISLANVNRWVFVYEPFNYPILLTMLHVLSNFLFGSFIVCFTPMGAVFGDADRMKIPPNLYNKVVILGMVYTASIACGNIALQYLYVSFVKMIFATTPLVTVVLYHVMFNRSYDYYVNIAMVPLCVGSMLCTVGEINFSVLGFLAAVTATTLRGIKSILQDILLKDEKIDSVSLLYHMSKPSLFLLVVATLIFESSAFTDPSVWMNFSLWFLIGLSCLCAIGYNIMNFLVTFYTSPVTLQVLGNVSMMLTVLLSLLIFQNEISIVSVTGIACVMVGTVMYQQSNVIRDFVTYKMSRSVGDKYK